MAVSLERLDTIIVGAGFGGCQVLHSLRNQGFKVKLFERASGLGGTWFYNAYPGARVDSDLPIYQFFDKDLWNDWEFSERFPGHAELREYFAYVDKKWNLSKDIEFSTEVSGARFDEASREWVVSLADGRKATATWFIPATGLASKNYVPTFRGLDKFRGLTLHTSEWPQGGVELAGKRVAVIGTGASGVQVIQEIGHEVEHLTVYQRTPNIALPMKQRTAPEQSVLKRNGSYERIFENAMTSFTGMEFTFAPRNTFDDGPEERKAFYESLYEQGGFRFWLATYRDMIFDRKANAEAYNFWVEKTRARITDPRKRDLLAPLTPPHPFGTKRPALEQHYYEVLNGSNVEIIDVSDSASPIIEITEKGVRTKEGIVEVDVIVLATGFDSVTGGLTAMNIVGSDGESLKDKWDRELATYLGMACNKFPNMFMVFGPQAPTAFANGPTIVRAQSEWILSVLVYLRAANLDRFEATADAQSAWVKQTNDAWKKTLFPFAKSWYQGSNIPGKKIAPLNWIGGMPSYIEACRMEAEGDYKGFLISSRVKA